MARLGRLALAIVLVGMAHSTSAKSANRVKNLGEASVGRFKVTLNDERLPLAAMEKNRTSLQPNLEKLWNKVYVYWYTYGDDETPPVEEQSRNLTAYAKEQLTEEEYNDLNERILREATKNATATPLFEGQPHHDVVFSYLETIWNISSATEYFMHGAYLGVGSSSTCSEHVNDVLANADEWAKMGGSAATTLMALLPTFLAFGNL